jgi:hypothetical protein
MSGERQTGKDLGGSSYGLCCDLPGGIKEDIKEISARIANDLVGPA